MALDPQRVSESCQRTAVRLRELQAELYQCGLTAEAADLEPVIAELISIAFVASESEVDEDAVTGVFRRPTAERHPPPKRR